MKLFFQFFILLLGLLLSSFVVVGQSNKMNANTKQEAERLWELAIEAKGGRERINKVQNMLITNTYGNKNYGLIGLYELPDKWWRYANDPKPLGTYVNMNNLAKDLYYVSDNVDNPNAFTEMSKTGDIELADVQLYFLLETKWVKPIPFDFTVENLNEKQTDVVKTMVGDKQVNFFFDKNSHLLLKIGFVSKSGKMNYWVSFSDYVLLNGIQIPTKVGYISDKKSITNIKFNVDYDKNLFETPPTIAAGPDAWKPKIKF